MADVSHMPRLRALVDAYRGQYGSSEGWVAEQMGLDRRGLWAWWNRGLSQMPSAELLHALASATRTPYRTVLDAALDDFGYLPGESRPSRSADFGDAILDLGVDENDKADPGRQAN